tara:strand:- start:38991 stop:39323 length:333 start_codon:yes stop_codon:yes gene_type:complete
MTPDERKAAIEKAQKDARAALILVKELKAHCEHRIRRFNSSSSAQCDVCGTHFGWFCPKSPDSVCHYETNEESMIELIDGNLSKPGAHWNGQKYETDDCCVFCGAPEERK